MKNKISIENDLLDIAARLRALDDGYRVYYIPEKSRYEVHNVNQYGDTLAFVVPYEQLDARTVEFARYTRVENADRLFAETDKSERIADAGF